MTVAHPGTQPPAGLGEQELRLLDLMTDPDRVATYARLREQYRVVACRHVDDSRVWLVTRYEDAKLVLADPRFASDSSRHGRGGMAAVSGMPEDVARYLDGNMLDRDPPEHTRLRRLVSRVFTARRISALAPQAQRLADALFDSAADQPEPDLVASFSGPYPSQVICELFGVPRHQWDDWARHAKGLTEMGPAMVDAARGLIALALDLIARKRVAPGADLVSELVALNDQDAAKLTDDELVTMVITLLGTGHESSVQFLSCGFYTLLTQEQHREALIQDPARVSAAVEEILRVFTPFELSGMRYPVEPVEIGGITIPAGEPVYAVLAAADRDPRVFPEPDRIDLLRGNTGAHLAFGHGLHFCIGAALARMQGEIAFTTLLRRFPAVSLAVPADELKWRRAFVNGPAALPVHLTPRGI
ncbi:cytochrome P450 family protein [Couchioplanes azureus]|uniref:cytochrome P450 family protein n=1 Tax=Couchioplanes caeruleus TaxID=56438 RepID=UPI001670DB76|nr:cytochrome P450 [Couchioplanes caeruleus]GGQ86367.1 cytochrome P450 hydroxylase [Couchioplanes caeruleus subsp. azureus]